MATVTDQYENLPGVKVNYEDGNLTIGAQSAGATTKSILLIGTATDGPIGEPISLASLGGPREAEKLFGGLTEKVIINDNGVDKTVNVPHQGSLVRSMWESYRGGNEDIRVLRLSGRQAKSEIPAKDPNSEVTQPLADASNNNFVNGNIAFNKALTLSAGERLVKIEKVEEFEGTDVTAAPYKTFPDSTGYQNVDTTVGMETVYFARDKFRPKNTIKVTYKTKKRTYTEVAHTADGVALPSTLGLLTQDPAMTNYFTPEVSNWSDDPMHTVNVFIKDAAGSVNAIPSVNASGEKLYRIGKEDATIVNELADSTTTKEFQQGGIRFTGAYQAEVAAGTYPALAASVQVTVDYFYYNDLEVQGEATHLVPGNEKVTFLNFTPETGTLVVYTELNANKVVLEIDKDYTLLYPSTSSEKIQVMIKAGSGIVGARLFASYKTGENAVSGAKLIVNAASAGKLYGGFAQEGDKESLTGVQFKVEFEVNDNGTIDMENRVIRFIKPEAKRLSSNDREIVLRTKNLPGIRTIQEFANYVNNLGQNNIVQLEVPLKTGGVPLRGLQVTDYNVSPVSGSYDYRPITLGERYNEATSLFELYEDDLQVEGSAARFPWVGDNGFFDKTSLVDMRALYEQLGGQYQLVAGSADDFELVEQGIYSQLENYAVDQITMLEAYSNSAIGDLADDGSYFVSPTKSFATQLAQHCAVVTAKTHEETGFVGMAPVNATGLRDIKEYVEHVTKGISVSEEKAEEMLNRGINPYFVNQHFMYNAATDELIYNDNGDPIDLGFYINNVFGPEVGLANEKLGSYVANGATMYATLASKLSAEISTTNQQMEVLGLRYNLSESQHNDLAGAGYVSFESVVGLNGQRTVHVKDGTTASLPTSDYRRYSTVTITHTTVQMIRRSAKKYIGLPNGLSQRNSLATEIQATLDKLKEKGLLENFKFSIYSSTRDRVLGNAFITLELVPAYELRRIHTTVGLRASL